MTLIMVAEERFDICTRLDDRDQIVWEFCRRHGFLGSLIQDHSRQRFEAAPALFGVLSKPLL
ncbi:MAG: hypothetical protein F4Y45_17990 [Acidobacteria bacterium]|nr:hypothetical protein [Acidobacteriota bacterium]MYJ05243.1 hypothetical protein [Acidobacteriota bacterium]